jgi:hypothetical protein
MGTKSAPHARPMNGKQQAVPAQFSRGWLDSLDGRLGLARDMRARFDAIASDLGGIKELTYARRSLIERVLWLEFWLAKQERELAEGRDVDMGRYTQGVNSLQGLFLRIGLDRVARRVPSLTEYLQRREAGG